MPNVLQHRHAARLAGLLLLAGHFAAWASHKTAALTLSGHELATFTNYTPNAGVFPNEGFLLPLWAAALLMALRPDARAGDRDDGASAWRWLWPALGIGIAVLGLPAYPELRKIAAGQASDFVAQLPVSVLTMALIAMAGRLPQRARQTLSAAAGVAALVAVAGFFAIRQPALEALYRDPVIVGLGVWMTLAGGMAALAIAFVTILATLSLKQRPH